LCGVFLSHIFFFLLQSSLLADFKEISNIPNNVYKTKASSLFFQGFYKKKQTKITTQKQQSSSKPESSNIDTFSTQLVGRGIKKRSGKGEEERNWFVAKGTIHF